MICGDFTASKAYLYYVACHFVNALLKEYNKKSVKTTYLNSIFMFSCIPAQ